MLYLSRRTAPFQVGDIPDIAESEQIELARKLIVDGFLIRISVSPSMAPAAQRR